MYIRYSLAHGLKIFFCGLFALSLTACMVYKPELRQGNVLTPLQIAQLKIGMPKSQVQLLLGSPLLQNVFNDKQWEYVFHQVSSNQTIVQSRFSVMLDASGKVIDWTNRSAAEQAFMQPMVAQLAASPSISLTPPQTQAAPVAVSLPVVAALTESVSPPQAAPLQALVSGFKIQTELVKSETKPEIKSEIKLEAKPAQVLAAANTAPLKTTVKQANVTAAADEAIAALIETWRANWQGAQFENYISHYSASFKGDRASRADWVARRKLMVEGREILGVTLSDIVIQQTSSTTARAYFKQKYQAAKYIEQGEKTLLFERIKGQWYIVGEIFNKV